MPELFERKDFGLAAKLPNTLTNDDMARLLYVLSYEEHLPALDKILEAGIPIDIRDKTKGRGLTALQISAGWLNRQRMEVLLERGADPKIRDRESRSALDHVVTSEKLSSYMEDYFIVNLMRRGSSISDGVRESIQILTEHGANLYAQDADSHTAFANALLAIKPEAVKAFLNMADAGEFDLLGSKVSRDLTAKQFCHGYSEGIAKGEVSGTDELFKICYHTDVEINLLQHKADCKKIREEIRAQKEAGTYVSPFPDNEPL